jgi:hypothetical protein
VHHSSLVAWQKPPFLIGAISPEALRYAIGGSILIELQIGHGADLRIGLGDLRIAQSRVEVASPLRHHWLREAFSNLGSYLLMKVSVFMLL